MTTQGAVMNIRNSYVSSLSAGRSVSPKIFRQFNKYLCTVQPEET